MGISSNCIFTNVSKITISMRWSLSKKSPIGQNLENTLEMLCKETGFVFGAATLLKKMQPYYSKYYSDYSKYTLCFVLF